MHKQAVVVLRNVRNHLDQKGEKRGGDRERRRKRRRRKERKKKDEGRLEFCTQLFFPPFALFASFASCEIAFTRESQMKGVREATGDMQHSHRQISH